MELSFTTGLEFLLSFFHHFPSKFSFFHFFYFGISASRITMDHRREKNMEEIFNQSWPFWPMG